MFKVKFIILATFTISFLFLFNSCTEGILGNDSPKRIVEILEESENHSTLSKIHERLRYTNARGTLFAPTDAAFEHYFNTSGLSLETMTDHELETLLRCHYLEVPTNKQALQLGYNNTIKEYLDARVVLLIERNSSGILLNRFATSLRTDIEAYEGVLHEVNQVLKPVTSMDLARFEDLDSFVVAMDRVDAATGIYSVIEQTGPYSIVAPKNEAFVESLANNNWNSIADVPISVLEYAMKEQIFDENLKFKNESSASMYSLNGNSAVYDDRDRSIADFPEYDAKIIQFEIQGVNGTLMITNEVFLF